MHIYNWDDWAQRTIPVPMVVGHEFVGRIVEVGRNVHGLPRPATSSAARGTWSAAGAAIAWPAGGTSAKDTKGVGVNRPGAFAEYLALPMTNVWYHDPAIPRDVQADLRPVRQRRPHRALVRRARRGRADHRRRADRHHGRAAVVRHAGARHVVVTDVNPVPPRTGPADGRDARRRRAARARSPTPRQQLGMKEGFDVGLEMSGNPDAFRDMLANMCHGGKIAMLGIPTREMAIDWNTVVFNMLTIKGIYGREMYETWYKMTVMLQSGLDITPVITHRFHFPDFEKGFAAMKSGESGKVVLTWHDG